MSDIAQDITAIGLPSAMMAMMVGAPELSIVAGIASIGSMVYEAFKPHHKPPPQVQVLSSEPTNEPMGL